MTVMIELVIGIFALVYLGMILGGLPLLMGALVFVAAALSAVFSNDIVCLAMAPVLIDACRGRDLAPRPFLLALACAGNIGSAATLIGNPQNMLIGETLRRPFTFYLREAALPVLLGLVATWALVFALTRRQLVDSSAAGASRRSSSATSRARESRCRTSGRCSPRPSCCRTSSRTCPR